MHNWPSKFEALLDRYRRDDGSRWSGAAIERATGGVVTRGYVSELRRGEIRDPGFSKIYLISQAMGIPLEVWVDD